VQYHEPVLLREILDRLDICPGKVVCDGTVGTAGHALEFLKALGDRGTLIGLDRDPDMLKRATQRLSEIPRPEGARVLLANARYEDLPAILEAESLSGADAVLLDLGINSLQVELPERGFSFSKDGPLDGRFDPNEPGTRSVAELVNTATDRELAGWMRDLADESYAKAIARRIVAERESAPIETTGRLAEIIAAAVPPNRRYAKRHPATKAFQALRIVANGELEAVERGVAACIRSLNPGGTLCVISYHSGEDRIVKRLFDEVGTARPDPTNVYAATTWDGVEFRVESRGAAKPSDEEIDANPRARSARLRTLRRVGEAA